MYRTRRWTTFAPGSTSTRTTQGPPFETKSSPAWSPPRNRQPRVASRDACRSRCAVRDGGRRFALIEDAAVDDADDAIAAGRQCLVVGDEQDRGAVLAVDRPQQREDGVGRL